MYGSEANARSSRDYDSGKTEIARGPLLADADSEVTNAIQRIEVATQQARTIADALFGSRPSLEPTNSSGKTPQQVIARGESLRRNLATLNHRITELNTELSRFEAI